MCASVCDFLCDTLSAVVAHFCSLGFRSKFLILLVMKFSPEIHLDIFPDTSNFAINWRMPKVFEDFGG